VAGGWALTTTTETFDPGSGALRATPPTPSPALRVLALGAVVLVAALGLLLRLWALGRWPVSSDEAIVGLMAKEILQGHFFAFYWGQSYGGGEPYVVAALFGVFGRSPFVLGLTPVLLDAVAALLVWRIGRRLFSPMVGAGAALLFWVWPETYLWESTLEYGFRWLALDCGLVVLLTALRLSDGTERPAKRVLLGWGVLGLAAGLGWWCTPEIAYYLLPAAALLVWRLAHRRCAVRARDLATAAGAALLGALPWIWANVTSGFSSLASVSQPNPSYPFFEHLKVLGVHVLPTLLGLRLRAAAGSPSAPWVFGTALGAVCYVLVLAGAVAWLVALVRRREALVLVAFVVVFPIGFAVSPFTWFWADARYAIYLAPVASLLAVSGVGAGLRRLARPEVSAVALPVAAGLGLTLWAVSQLIPYTPVDLAVSPRAGWFSWQADPTGFYRQVAHTLAADGIHDAYAGYWVAYVLDLEERDHLVVTPGRRRYVRYQPYADEVAASTDPAWIFFQPADHPVLASLTGSPLLDPGCAAQGDPCLSPGELEGWLALHRLSYRVVLAGYFEAVVPSGRVPAASVLAEFGMPP